MFLIRIWRAVSIGLGPSDERWRVKTGQPAGGARHLYVHVPFCARRCSYCDFAIAVRRATPVDQFIAALMAELAVRRSAVDWSGLATVYLGGGTPSRLGGAGIQRLLTAFAQQAGVDGSSTWSRQLEITIEANPEDVSAEAASVWAGSGVSRVSLGVQSFDGAVLTWMHRGHRPGSAAEAVRRLRDAGIRDVSLDLIFALPAALDRDWSADLTRALELEPDHLSVYGLTVEAGTPLGRWVRRGEAAELPDERYSDEFLAAHSRLTSAGFEHYEVSNYARPGRRSRHNSAYWTGAPYLGLGPSAHSFDGTARRWNVSAYAAWSKRLAAGGDPLEGEERLSEIERADEEVYLGLRSAGGTAIRKTDLKTVTRWVAEGWAELRADRVLLTESGWLRLDALAVDLTSSRSRS